MYRCFFSSSTMPTHDNVALVIGACLSLIAALLRVGIVFGGAPWYRFFGAGERMATAAAAGRAYPAVVTLLIAAVLTTWAAYALSGAGAIAPLALLRLALVAITAVYLLRGMAIIPLWLFARGTITPFLVWSSLVCTGYGLVHLAGLSQEWARL